jgi:phenylacetic acid degradation operon negative regulatory protein
MTEGAPHLILTVAAPTMSRRHATGAESARGLLFTVLGEFVLPNGGVAWTSAIIDVLSRLEVEEKASRQALMRTAADGWLTPERVGRRTRWQLTANAEQLLTEGTERIYSHTGAAAEWDGRWLLALARVPETDRPARHLLRTRLSWAGFGSPAPGVWICAHTERLAEAEEILDRAGILNESRIFVAEHRGGGDLVTMVDQAWALTSIDDEYRDFLAAFAPAGRPPAGRRPDPVARLIDLVHSWRRFPSIDPNLPLELLPKKWSGTTAAKVFAQRHAKWAADATAEWIRINEHGG